MRGDAALYPFVTMLDDAYEESNLFCGYTRVEEPAADLLLRLADRMEAVQS